MVGKLHLDDQRLPVVLNELRSKLPVEEVMIVSTCNRVEFLFSVQEKENSSLINDIFAIAYPDLDTETKQELLAGLFIYRGEEALDHLFQVVSSLDSLVVGEREIITQVRDAYEKCRSLGSTGDLLRIVIKKAIETGKAVYTQTQIAHNPVSVVSLAYRKLRDLNVPLSARFLIIGAGVTNTTMGKYLKKHGFKNFVVFNRSLSNAETLANELEGSAYPLEHLAEYASGFDVIVTCTGAAEPIITNEIYTALLGNDKSRKIVIDLAVPNDVAEDVISSHDINLIAVNNLRDVAEKNLKGREKELEACMRIIKSSLEDFRHDLRARKIELAMSDVPKTVKQIRENALNEVFAKELRKLDPESRELLEKMLAYMEKKYISVPMKMAKEILLEGYSPN
jgi:glutamyl-tRNA reductase